MPSPPPFLDPRVGEWTFDANTLISFAQAHLNAYLVMNFQGRAHLVDAVPSEIDKGPAGSLYRSFHWFREETLILGTPPAQNYASIRQRWGWSDPNADRGEATCIVLGEAHGWRFATDDGTGYQAGIHEGVPTTRTP